METCTHPGCARLVKAKTLCRTHYMQNQRTGKTWNIGTNPHRGRKFCTFPECGKPRFARGLCQGHAAQVRKGQEPRPLAQPRPTAQEGYAWCSTCKQFWPIDSFDWDPTRGQPKRVCLDCRAQAAREKRQGPAHRATHRRWTIRKLYGIEPEEYEALYAQQDGKCAICSTPVSNYLRDLDASGRGTCVDHCHDSSRVRGILCHGCNIGLGGFRDDPVRLLAAVEYLRS